MNVRAFQSADRWIAAAIEVLDPRSPSHAFLRGNLTELRQRIAQLPMWQPSVAAARDVAAGARSAKLAIDEAVAALRTSTDRLTAAETTILSKLLVIQSTLCTPRFTELR